MRFLDSEWGEKKYNLPREMAVTVVHSTQAQATVTASHELVSQALSSHPRALVVDVRASRRDFSAASHGSSPGPEHVPDFLPCRLAAAAADWPLTAESGGDSRGVDWWAPLLGRRRSERGRRQGFRAPAACSPAARRAGVSTRPSLRTRSEWSLPPVRCSSRPCLRQQSLRSRHFIGWLRGHAEQEFAGDRRIVASGSDEAARTRRGGRMSEATRARGESALLCAAQKLSCSFLLTFPYPPGGFLE